MGFVHSGYQVSRGTWCAVWYETRGCGASKRSFSFCTPSEGHCPLAIQEDVAQTISRWKKNQLFLADIAIKVILCHIWLLLCQVWPYMFWFQPLTFFWCVLAVVEMNATVPWWFCIFLGSSAGAAVRSLGPERKEILDTRLETLEEELGFGRLGAPRMVLGSSRLGSD